MNLGVCNRRLRFQFSIRSFRGDLAMPTVEKLEQLLPDPAPGEGRYYVTAVNYHALSDLRTSGGDYVVLVI